MIKIKLKKHHLKKLTQADCGSEIKYKPKIKYWIFSLKIHYENNFLKIKLFL